MRQQFTTLPHDILILNNISQKNSPPGLPAGRQARRGIVTEQIKLIANQV
jgi:hypothetical protein